MNQPSPSSSNPYLKRNFAFNVLDGCFSDLSMTFLAMGTVVPVFAQRLGASSSIIALIPFISTLFFGLGPLIATHRIEQLDRKKPFVLLFGALQRSTWMGVGLFCLLLGFSHPKLLLISLFGMLMIGQVIGGLVLPAWFDLVSSVVPVSVRGRMMSMRSLTGNLVAIPGAALLTWMLGNIPFPYNFGCVFLSGFGFSVVSLLWIGLLKESHSKRTLPPRKRSELLRSIPGLLRRDRNFFYFVITRVSALVSFSASALFSAYAMKRFNLPDSHSGVFTSLIVVSIIAAGPVIGWLSDRKGHKNSFSILLACGTIAAMAALFAPNPKLYGIVYVCLGVMQACFFISNLSLTVEFCSEEQRPLYIATIQILSFPAALLTLSTGALADLFGFQTTFAVLALISAGGALFSTFVLRDPRFSKRQQSLPAVEAA